MRDIAELRNLCIEEGYFTCGSNREYNILFNVYKDGEDLSTIAAYIARYSDSGINREDVLQKLLDLEKDNSVYQEDLVKKVIALLQNVNSVLSVENPDGSSSFIGEECMISSVTSRKKPSFSVVYIRVAGVLSCIMVEKGNSYIVNSFSSCLSKERGNELKGKLEFEVNKFLVDLNSLGVNNLNSIRFTVGRHSRKYKVEECDNEEYTLIIS